VWRGFPNFDKGSTNGTKEEREKGIKIKTVQSMVELIVSSSQEDLPFSSFNFFLCFVIFLVNGRTEKRDS
jgi:hypothetical protein